jgi:hypothetical protein
MKELGHETRWLVQPADPDAIRMLALRLGVDLEGAPA